MEVMAEDVKGRDGRNCFVWQRRHSQTLGRKESAILGFSWENGMFLEVRSRKTISLP